MLRATLWLCLLGLTFWAGALDAAAPLRRWWAGEARLVISTRPEVPFSVRIPRTATTISGAQEVVLEAGDHLVEVIPHSTEYARKQFKVHLRRDQRLEVPVYLGPR